jgi:hypothetical protein
MTAEVTALVVGIIGLVLYALSVVYSGKRFFAALKPIGLIAFGVGLLLWVGSGPHTASLHIK